MKEFNKIKICNMKFSNFNLIDLKYIITQKNNDNIDLMKNILKWIPNNWININDVLNHLFILIILLVNLFLILITIIVILKYN